MSRAATWTHAILFQLTWLCAVGGAARGWWWAGPLAMAAFALFVLRIGGNVRSDLFLALVAAACGFALDTLWVRTGLLTYAAPVPWTNAAPVWIVALWIDLALSLNYSLAWLLRRPLLAALFGAIGGPLSYFFAARTWHAAVLGEPLARTLFVTPLLCALALRLSGPRGGTPDLDVLPAAAS
jgi:hypothetical protein